MVAAFLPVSGVESTWDERGGNSNAVRNTELMMECNDCLFEGWNQQTSKTHLKRWPDKSEVETHIVRIGHIMDKPEGDKMLGDPGVWETSPGKGDGSRLYFVNSWAMKWSQHP